jgi:hypothetical protein
MAIDPIASTIEALLGSSQGGTAATGPVAEILKGLARRPVWIEQIAAHEAAAGARSTAPVWRWVRMRGPMSTVAARGTSMAATVSGAAGLAMTLGIPLVVAVGTWVMLGSGYYLARKRIRQKGTVTGFAQGFVMGVLNWQWHHAWSIFGRPYVVRANSWDARMDVEETLGLNEGLHKGFGLGSATPEDRKKGYRIALRRLAGRHDAGPWSRNSDEAHLQQRNYVLELAGAGVRQGLIVAE